MNIKLFAVKFQMPWQFIIFRIQTFVHEDTSGLKAFNAAGNNKRYF